MRILVVEDDDHVAGALQSALNVGMRSSVRPAARRRWRRAGGVPPLDLVLLDLGLPDSKGLQLSVTLRPGRERR